MPAVLVTFAAEVTLPKNEQYIWSALGFLVMPRIGSRGFRNPGHGESVMCWISVLWVNRAQPNHLGSGLGFSYAALIRSG